MIGDTLWAWQVLEQGEWGLIAGVVPGMGPAPLVARNSDLAARFADVAKAHGKATGLPVRLAKFELVEEHSEDA